MVSWILLVDAYQGKCCLNKRLAIFWVWTIFFSHSCFRKNYHTCSCNRHVSLKLVLETNRIHMQIVLDFRSNLLRGIVHTSQLPTSEPLPRPPGSRFANNLWRPHRSPCSAPLQWDTTRRSTRSVCLGCRRHLSRSCPLPRRYPRPPRAHGARVWRHCVRPARPPRRPGQGPSRQGLRRSCRQAHGLRDRQRRGRRGKSNSA